MSHKSSQNGIKLYFQQLNNEKLKALFSLPTYFKGSSYYQEGRIENIETMCFNKLEAEVVGRTKYSLSLSLENGVLMTSCSCPIGGNCKHVVAAMIYAMEHVEELEELKEEFSQDKFQDYLASLSKNELRELVLKFAPQSFKTEIKNSYLEIDQAKKLFEKTAQKLKNLLIEVESYYEPSDFEGQLTGFFEKLKGIWYKFPTETGDLIIEIIEKIGDALDEGMLYDHYYDDIYDGREFLTLIQEYISGLPIQNKIKFISRFEDAISSMTYEIFADFWYEKEKIFHESEKPDLKIYFLDKLRDGNLRDAAGYYQFLGEMILPSEKEMVLENIYHLNSELCLELTEIYERQGKQEKAINLLEGLLEANPGFSLDTEILFKKLIQIKKEIEEPFEKDAFKALDKHSSISLLEMIVSYLPAKKEAFENSLKSKDNNRFLEYLVKHQRIAEALQLVLASKTLMESSIYNFYIHHFKSCREEAMAYFINRINKELPYTGDKHYEIIRDSLVYIKKIDRNKAATLVEMLRREYNRRRNLIALLSNF